MTRLLVGNSCDEEVAPVDLKSAHWKTQVMFWWARDGDVLLLAAEPNEAFGRYVCELTGTDYSTLRVVVPENTRAEDGRLTRERLLDPRTIDALRHAFDRAAITEIFATWPSTHVASLARALNSPDALPGFAFQIEGGARLVTSKCDFRAIGSAVGVPLPDGVVCRSRSDAAEAIKYILRSRDSVMVKAEYNFGGAGNEVLTKRPGVTYAAARATVQVSGSSAVESYLDDNWDRLSESGRSGVNVEQFHEGSRSVFVEYEITEDDIRWLSDGEMLLNSKPAAEMMPAKFLDEDHRSRLDLYGSRLARALQAIGYRGTVSADAIVTPAGELLFTEWNGRRTDSTHIHACIGRRVLGDAYGTTHVLHDCVRWNVPSHEAAISLLRSNGLLYNPVTKIGVIPCTAHNARRGRLTFCVSHVDEASAAEMELAVRAIDVSACPVPEMRGGERNDCMDPANDRHRQRALHVQG